MADTAAFKQVLKDASDDEAKELYGWATVCMEVRGLIPLAGTRKRRSDAGKPRNNEEPGDEEKRFMGVEPTLQLREPGQ